MARFPSPPGPDSPSARRLRGVPRGRAILLALALPALWIVAWTHPAWGPRAPVLCMMKRTTGLPCAFCGGTRAAAELARGRPAAALAMNPLATLLLLAGAGEWLRRLARAGFADGAPPRLLEAWRNDSRMRRAAIALGILLVIANWAYVLARAR